LYQLVIFPAYKEDIGILRASLEALKASRYPKDKIMWSWLLKNVINRPGNRENIGKEFSRILEVICPRFILTG